jgi:glutamine amidotransferase
LITAWEIWQVSECINEIKQECIISSDAKELKSCEKLILPGVGAFGDCMANINETRAVFFSQRRSAEGKPVLGNLLRHADAV